MSLVKRVYRGYVQTAEFFWRQVVWQVLLQVWTVISRVFEQVMKCQSCESLNLRHNLNVLKPYQTLLARKNLSNKVDTGHPGRRTEISVWLGISYIGGAVQLRGAFSMIFLFVLLSVARSPCACVAHCSADSKHQVFIVPRFQSPYYCGRFEAVRSDSQQVTAVG